MCTYLTEKIEIDASGKTPQGWTHLTQATVYVDHPVHHPQEHTVNIDFINPDRGPAARVALEMTQEAAEALVAAIQQALAAAPAGLASAAAAASAAA
ncbi:DUF6295 family protein [Streptomyces sp. SL13]|uniref:DUF6295 family protein n=1 Tax=Streptantibioticus silvisoli TaxID=2705255 RepID=A0AA90HDF4_9ACTN|nr:DUF6295 family protein [Streptantibioticus silvisoli]MDI5961805.1 DUF6295 family protein [Streptantibioticus silvisoli]MDI5974342.1 DUF6295 family protein [Streptantibioticus silvisoli]